MNVTSTNRFGFSRKHKRLLKIGTWNVRTLIDNDSSNRPERRTALVAKELQRYGINVAALSETRFADQGKLTEPTNGYTFFWSGLPSGTRREAGVGFAVAGHLLSRIDGEPNCINSRLITMRLRLSRGQFATLVSVYASMMTHTNAEKSELYAQLTHVLQTTPRKDRLLLLSDFNARVGQD